LTDCKEGGVDEKGKVAVPFDALYGPETTRALGNFRLSRHHLADYPALVRALLRIKLAYARVNGQLGQLSLPIAQAIVDAASDIVSQLPSEQFPVDMIHGGGGTSVNMNVNEVLATLASRALGDDVLANDHVNCGQSTNDVYPAAIRIAVINQSIPLVAALAGVRQTLNGHAEAFASVIKLGRTCLRDAVPMTVGQAFGGYASALARVTTMLHQGLVPLHELGLGGTVLGTGIGAHPELGQKVIEQLATESGLPFRQASNLFDAAQNLDGLAAFSGQLKTAAITLSRIASDLRLLSSGPEGGLGEVRLPAVQAGSSIMPGKVNPVIAEAVNQIAFRICGLDTAVTMAVEQGELDLNCFEPIVALSLLEGVELLTNAARMFDERCLRGLDVDRERCAAPLRSVMPLNTIVATRLGYARVSALLRAADQAGRSLAQHIVAEGLATDGELASWLAEAIRAPATAEAGQQTAPAVELQPSVGV
jgi:aspartate ammonia-lyase